MKYLFSICLLISVILLAACRKFATYNMKSLLTTESTPVRYKDSVFAEVDTTTFFNVLYRIVANYDITENLALDVYLPIGDTMTKRAAVIFMHGGGWSRNHPEYNRKDPDVKFLCEKLAKRGYVVISPSYRTGIDWNANGQNITDSLNNYYETIYRAAQDARACVRFVKAASEIGKIDTNKIFIGGESAGAVNAINSAYLDLSEVPLSFINKWGQLDGTGTYDYSGYSAIVKGILNVEGIILDTNYIDTGNSSLVSFYGSADPFYFGSSVDVVVPDPKILLVNFNNGHAIHIRTTALNIATPPITVYQGGEHGSTFNIFSNRLNSIEVMSSWMHSRLQQ